MTASQKLTRGLRSYVTSVAQGFFQISHNSFALVGLAVMFVIITLTARPELRQLGEVQLFSWLQTRQLPINGLADAMDPAVVNNAQDLPKQQAAVANWLSKKYRIAPDPLNALVAEAYDIGLRIKLDPTLILAVIAVESGFNPFAQSQMGAQGLMQVMTRVHGDKYQGFGGKQAAFEPLSNLQVGVKVLKECIARAGSVDGGLRLYVGASNVEVDGGYANKVMAEQARLELVAKGRKVPLFWSPANSALSSIKPDADREKIAARAIS